MKAILFRAAGLLAPLVLSSVLFAQLPYQQSFKNSAASGVLVSGTARLTAASGIDPEGDGYLRLTDNTTNQVGYAYAKTAFPSDYGLTTTFEFYTYRAGANGVNQADGISFFLFDASVNAFRPGGLGGSLGYAQYYTVPGMTKGYLGIGIDEYGNFSDPNQGRSGGPGRTAGSIVVRGPGDGKKTTDYVYISGVRTDSSAFNIPITKFTQRYPDFMSPNYRRIKIILTPGSSLGANKGFTITVTLFKGGTPSGTEVTLINNADYPYLSPAKLQYGFAASTGSNTDFHEIRNLNIVPTLTAGLLAPTVANDSVAVCQGPDALLDVTANDVSNNTGGSIDKATIDLDPATTGLQITYTDAGKGTYTVDQNGIVTFKPVSGFVGNSLVEYTVNDTYGKTSSKATVGVTVSSVLGPSLTVTDPAGACAPATVDITNAALRSNTTAGAAYSYFATLSDANNNANDITATAGALSAGGLYFIRANSGSCYTVQPVTVQVSQAPTAAVSGNNQNLCAPGSASLTANDPAVGTGNWSQVSGPSTAAFTTPTFSTTSVTGLQKGTYQLRWTIANGACAASVSNLTIKVTNTSVAGSNQSLTNTTSTTLQGNDPSPGTGAWTQVGGPVAAIATPSNAQSAVTGLVNGNTYTFKWTITNGCPTSSQMTVTVAGALPVRLLSFSGEKNKEGVLLKWRTASERDNEQFVVEKSRDNALYSPVGQVAGAGTTSTGQAYSFFDKDGVAQDVAVYYRLKQLDKNGDVSYSAVVRISPDGTVQKQLQVWPNPCKEAVRIGASFEKGGTANLRLYDRVGRLVLQKQRVVEKGENVLYLLLPEGAPKSLYVLELETGEEKHRQKIIRE